MSYNTQAMNPNVQNISLTLIYSHFIFWKWEQKVHQSQHLILHDNSELLNSSQAEGLYNWLSSIFFKILREYRLLVEEDRTFPLQMIYMCGIISVKGENRCYKSINLER